MLRTPRYAEQGQGGGWGWEGGTRRELTVASSRLTTLDKLVVPSGTRRLDLRDNALLSLDSDSGRPPWPGQLEEVDLSGNRLVVLRGLGSHAHLHTLNLSNNSLLRLDGHVLSQLPRLASLNISHNSLSSIDEVVACRHTLRQLTASHNSLTQLPAIAHCSALQELDLGKNMIAALGDIPDRLPRSLRFLRLDCNTIGELGELRGLAWITNLAVLGLADNPFVATAAARGINPRPLVAFLLPRLQQLDRRGLAAEEVSTAGLLFRRPRVASGSSPGSGGGGGGDGGGGGGGVLEDELLLALEPGQGPALLSYLATVCPSNSVVAARNAQQQQQRQQQQQQQRQQQPQRQQRQQDNGGASAGTGGDGRLLDGGTAGARLTVDIDGLNGMGGLNGGGALVPGGNGSISLESPMESPNGPRPTGAMRVRSLSLKKRNKRAAAGGLAGGQEESMFPPPPRPMHGGGPRDPLSQSAPSPLGGRWMQSSSPTRPPRRMMGSPSSRGSPMRGSPMRGSPIRGGGPLLGGEMRGGDPVGMLSGKATPSEMIHYVQRMATQMEGMQRRIMWHETQRGGQNHSRRSDLSASMPLRMSPGGGGGGVVGGGVGGGSGGGVPFAGAAPALVPPLNGAFGSRTMPPGGFSSAPPTHVNEWIRSPPTMGHRSPASATQRSSPAAAAKAKGGGGSEAAEAHRFRDEMALLYPPLSAVLPPRRRRAGGASGLRDNVPSIGSAEGYAAHMATRVQSWARGRAVRRFMDQYRAQAEAATYVQAAWRGHLTRCGDEGGGDGRGGGGRGERGGGDGVERTGRDGRGGRSPRSPREGGGGGRGRDRELRRLQKQVDFLEENSEAQVNEGSQGETERDRERDREKE